MRLDLGFGDHPVELVDPAVHRADHILDQLVGRSLGFGRIILRDIQLADVILENAGGEGDGALPAGLLLGGARQGRAVEGEIFLVERTRKVSRVAIERADEQLILEHAERRLVDQRGDLRDRAWLRHDQRADALRAAVADHAGEVIARRRLGELGKRHLVVGLGRIAAFDAGPAGVGDPGLEREDRLGAGGGIGLAGKGQDIGQMLEIFGAGLGQLGIGLKVIIAVRHAEARLTERENIFLGILVVLPDIAAERSTDAHLARRCIKRGETGLRLHAADLVEPRLDRGQALRLDRRFVHEAGIDRADPAVGVVRGILDQAPSPLARQIVEQSEHAVIRLVGRDRGVLGPSAIGIIVEIIARYDIDIHAGLVETEGADRRLGPRGRFHRRSGFRHGRRHRCRHGLARAAREGGGGRQ